VTNLIGLTPSACAPWPAQARAHRPSDYPARIGLDRPGAPITWALPGSRYAPARSPSPYRSPRDEVGRPCGAGVRELAAAWKERGEYVRSHALQALALECAEAFAEMLHSRTLWGFPNPPELPISEKLKARYQGIRVSFGYPACPNLADQATLFRLLEPQCFGLTLTEGFMMDPEAIGVRRRKRPEPAFPARARWEHEEVRRLRPTNRRCRQLHPCRSPSRGFD
jgi:Vitamin B12 dependent methionine synthase, activation domain